MHNLGYVGVIIFQQLAITGLLWAILHLLNRLRRMDGSARMQVRENPANLSIADRETAYREAPTLAGRAG